MLEKDYTKFKKIEYTFIPRILRNLPKDYEKYLIFVYVKNR